MSMVTWCGTESSLHQHIETKRRHMVLEQELAKSEHPEKMLASLYGAQGPRCDITFRNFWGDEPPEYSEQKDPLSSKFRKGWCVLDTTPSGMATIRVQGTLVPNYNIWQAVYPDEETSYECINDALRIVESDDDIIGVVMTFNSGGGYASGMDECGENIRALSKIKPVSGYTGTYSFSASYGLMSACSSIMAYPAAEVGSIGTLMVHTNVVDMLEKQGIKSTVFRAGEFKALGLPVEELDDKARSVIQKNIDQNNEFFVRAVSQRRNIPLSAQSRWGEGKTFFAEEAKDLGLIDSTGTFKELFDREVVAYYIAHNQKGTSPMPMNISQEKLSLIAAGKPANEVLNAEELKEYEEALQRPLNENEPTKEGGEGGEEPKPTEETVEPPAPQSVDATTIDRMLAMGRDLAKAEAKLEHQEAQLAAAKADTESAKSEANALLPLAEYAVTCLQNVLNKRDPMPSTARGLADKYAELRTEQCQRFPTGQRSAVNTQEPKASSELLRRLEERKASQE